MKAFNRISLVRWSMVLSAVLFLASCGGGSGDSGSGVVMIGGGMSATAAAPQGADSSAGFAVPGNSFTANLTGAQEVPPVRTTATGTGVVVIDPDTLAMKATIVTAGITATAAHIHVAPPGLPGPVIFPLIQTFAGSGIWTTQTALTAAQLSALRAGSYYFNVHTAAYPEGEIRGQIIQQWVSSAASGTAVSASIPISTGPTGSGGFGTGMTGTGTVGTPMQGIAAIGTTPAGTGIIGTPLQGIVIPGAIPGPTGTSGSGTAGFNVGGTGGVGGVDNIGSLALLSNTFVTGLSGAQEVPPVATNAFGVGLVVVDPGTLVMKTAIVTIGLDGSAAHIHAGPRGIAGPIVFPLAQTFAASGIWTTQTTLTANQLNALRVGNYYFNVHSPAHPDGEIRGQIGQGMRIDGTGTGTARLDTRGTGAPAGSGLVAIGTDASGAGPADWYRGN